MNLAKLKKILLTLAVPFALVVAVMLLLRAKTNAKANGVDYATGVRKELEYLFTS